MIYALNEIEATCRKAARGAGYTWGLAEEIGKAARALAGHGLPGPDLLLAHLKQIDRQAYDDWAPTGTEGAWQARGGLLCPLIAGITLCDYADKIVRDQTLNCGPMAYPLLLAPFAGRAAELGTTALLLAWQDVTIHCGSGRLRIDAEGSGLLVPRTDAVRCLAQKSNPAEGLPGRDGREIDEAVWRGLSAFAHKTYVPATEASRLAGAGAGTCDND